MGKIKQTKKVTYRKSKSVKDKNGRLHCKECGAYLSGRGKKKS